MWIFLFWKIAKIALISQLNITSDFSRRCLDCPRNKIVYNFDTTCPNEINQSFPYRQKYNLWEKKLKDQNYFEFFFVAYLPSVVLNLCRYNFFFSLHQLKKKLYSQEDNQFFYFQKEFQKIMTKIETVGTYSKFNLSSKGTIVLLEIKH